jgi:3,4-dihydroxy 2-butanone 4-phosphate synthase
MDKESIIGAIMSGRPIVLYDSKDREGEADLVIHASFATPGMVRMLREEAGGLICVATDSQNASRFGLPFFADLLAGSGDATLAKLSSGAMPYGGQSAFSLWVNHRSTFTGITDNDRSATITRLERLIASKDAGAQEFAQEFYSPGHVPLLVSRGIESRKWHTELSIQIAKSAGMAPAVVVCEMLGKDGRALSWSAAQAYAKKRKLPSVGGQTLLNMLSDK